MDTHIIIVGIGFYLSLSGATSYEVQSPKIVWILG